MKLTLVRHPQTHDNIKKRMCGFTNSKVTPTGKIQIERTAKRLAKVDFDAVYCSDLTRCVLLARAFHKQCPAIPIIYTKELRERNFGIYEGMARERFNTLENNARDIESFRPPKGESSNQTTKRIAKFLEKIKKNRHKHILIITHGGIKRRLLKHALDVTLDYINHNTGVSYVDLKTKKVYYLADVSHLPKRLHTY